MWLIIIVPPHSFWAMARPRYQKSCCPTYQVEDPVFVLIMGRMSSLSVGVRGGLVFIGHSLQRVSIEIFE